MSDHHADHHVVHPGTYLKNLAALMVLMVLTIVAARWEVLHFGQTLNLAIALTIAVAKMMCILLIFMHVKFSSRLVAVFASAGFFWFVILMTLTFCDYASRAWHSPTALSPYLG